MAATRIGDIRAWVGIAIPLVSFVAGGGVLGYVSTNNAAAIKEVRADVTELKVNEAAWRVHTTMNRDRIEAIDKKLDKLDEKLDRLLEREINR